MFTSNDYEYGYHDGVSGITHSACMLSVSLSIST